MDASGTVDLLILGGFLAVPVAGVLAMFAARRPRRVLAINLAASIASGALSLVLALRLSGTEVVAAAEGFLRADHFSAWHLLALTLAVFTPASLFSFSYFREDKGGSLREMRRFGMLWQGSLASMSLALISGNIGIMWVAIEASTLFTAFLILREGSPASLEAMWRYIIMCSVGVAFAFIGTLLFAAAAQKAGLSGGDSLLLAKIYGVREQLSPSLAMAGFVFILIGYGTKAGLAPMHNWLPDAHSQAPAPVSAMFSGFLLNTALYCIVRFLPLAGADSLGLSRPLQLLMFIAVLSIVLSSIFIFFQKDAKRMLAYCSVEHLGIMAFGYALGPAGTFAALLHTLGHALAKTTGFFSAGMLGRKLGGNELFRFDGAAKRYPLWGRALALSLLALIGVAPFSTFMSEFMTVKAGVDASAWLPVALFLAATCVVFVRMLGQAIALAWKPIEHAPAGTRTPCAAAISDEAGCDEANIAAAPREKEGLASTLVVAVPLALLLVLGLWIPGFLSDFLRKAGEALWSVK
jgi:hydrogenase-4 component F